jgi:hypothetical protein
MTPTPEQIEAVARAICETENGPCDCLPDECGCTYWTGHARAAIAAARPFIRAEALEEAEEAVNDVGDHADGNAYVSAIRALKEKP